MGAVKKSKKQAEIYLTLSELNPYVLNPYVLNLGEGGRTSEARVK